MAARVLFRDRSLASEEGESVLVCLSRNGINIPHSCQSGVCQSCLMQLREGTMQPEAQGGLKPTLQKQGLFLACQFKPKADVVVDLPESVGLECPAVVVSKEMLNHNVLRILLRPSETFACEPGQYITVINCDAVARSYSIANNPAKDGVIELHIRLIENGRMSIFVRDKLKAGDVLTLRGPAGTCFYVPEDGTDYPIYLAGTGTGLAPLIGIAKQALGCGHLGDIQLFHGALQPADLYLGDELTQLSGSYKNFRYNPCVLRGQSGKPYLSGDVCELVMAALPPNKTATRLFLCGAPDLVNTMRRKAFLAGIASKHIFADPFLPSKSLAQSA